MNNVPNCISHSGLHSFYTSCVMTFKWMISLSWDSVEKKKLNNNCPKLINKSLKRSISKSSIKLRIMEGFNEKHQEQHFTPKITISSLNFPLFSGLKISSIYFIIVRKLHCNDHFTFFVPLISPQPLAQRLPHKFSRHIVNYNCGTFKCHRTTLRLTCIYMHVCVCIICNILHVLLISV